MLYEKAFQEVKKSPYLDKMGMILVHLGIVRSSSRKGETVRSVQVDFDDTRIQQIREEMLRRPGIYELVILTNRGLLKVGEEIMAVAVGGDVRENVFPVLMETVNRIKAEASHKVEFG